MNTSMRTSSSTNSLTGMEDFFAAPINVMDEWNKSLKNSPGNSKEINECFTMKLASSLEECENLSKKEQSSMYQELSKICPKKEMAENYSKVAEKYLRVADLEAKKDKTKQRLCLD